MLSTPGGALPYENQPGHEVPHAMCPSMQDVVYKHCGNSGQAKYGRILTPARRYCFKRSFEIGVTRGIGIC
jgi:hypothetical protein